MNPIRPFGHVDVYAPTGSQAQAFDQRAIQQYAIPGSSLMEAAGRSAASVVQECCPTGRVWVFAGSGNNGGDAVVVARTLAAWGRSVRLVRVGSSLKSELAHGWDVEVADSGVATLHSDDVVIDGMLGTGLTGAPRPEVRQWIDRINGSGASVFGLDVPSGINADDGSVPGAAVRAHVTVAFGWPKLGCLLHPARAYAGRVIAVEIGFPPLETEFPARLVTPGWFGRERPPRDAVTHKNRVGALLVVAGRSGMAGAAIIAVRSALRAGVGLVRVASVGANRTILQEAVPEAVFVDALDVREVGAALVASDAALVGPGLGQDAAARRVLDQVLADPGRAATALDADALNLLAEDGPDALARAARGRSILLTPHPGEMKRLLDMDDAASPHPADARAFAERTGAVVLLKGTPSVVASPDGTLLIGTQGSSDLASAGMGDLLAGAAGAFLAQGKSPAASAGLALHLSGRAANLASAGRALIPQDVVARMPDVWREEGSGHTDLRLPFVTFDQDPPR